MVMSASADPRTWSAVVIGGKMDGAPGPGVGSDKTEVHAGWVGMIIFVGKTKLGSGVGVLAVEQAEIVERRTMKEKMIKGFDGFMNIIFESFFEVV